MAYRVLVADDEAEIRELLRLYLEKDGYQVLEAQDGAIALSLMEREEIDMVLLDIMMPKMDGYHVLKKIRENSNIPIMMQTRYWGLTWERTIIWQNLLIRWRPWRGSIPISAGFIPWGRKERS